MTFIATYWWVWLIGLLVCGGYGIWKWFLTFFRTGGTMLRVASFTLESVEVASDTSKTVSERAGHARERVVEEVAKEGSSRLKEMGMGFAAIVAANIFGVLLVIAIVVGLIDYFKS